MKNTMSVDRRTFLRMTGLAALSLPVGEFAAAEKNSVIVIGAGATGCNVAWHLQKLGYAVTVLESEPGPATQASRAAAGFVAHWSALHIPAWGAVEHEMQNYGIDFYRQVAKRSKQETGFKSCGISFIYTKQDAWEKAQERIAKGRKLGIPFEVLSEARCRELLPIIRYDKIAGVAYDPTSIRVRAADMIPAIAEECRRRGVKFRFNTKAEAIVEDQGRVKGVKTNKGFVAAETVVIAAGAWSLQFLKEQGINLPVTPLIESRYTTQALPEVPAMLPLMIFSDIGFYIREEMGGLLIGGADDDKHEDRQVAIDRLPLSENMPHPVQIDRIREHVKVIDEVMPVLKTTTISTIKAGIPTFTDDVRFVADAVPGASGLFVLTACQEAGVTHGPALGRDMADFIHTGKKRQGFDIFSITRFKA